MPAIALQSLHKFLRDSQNDTDCPDVRLRLSASEVGHALDVVESRRVAGLQIELEILRDPGDPVPDCAVVRRLTEAGVRSVATSLTLDPGLPEETIQTLAFLRECSASHITVHWEARGSRVVQWRQLIHLPPPAGVVSDTKTWAEAWRRSHRTEALTFRKGPGFILLQDMRDDQSQSVICLDEPISLSVFADAMYPCSMADMVHAYGKAVRHHISQMVKYGLFFRAGDWIVNLAHVANRCRIPYKW